MPIMDRQSCDMQPARNLLFLQKIIESQSALSIGEAKPTKLEKLRTRAITPPPLN